MGSLTVRSIPDELLARLRALAAIERRSVNSEILILLERGLEREAMGSAAREHPITPELQTRLWEDLCGRWTDERSWEEIAADIISHRTSGRKVKL